ncbi:hypothetical protein [Neisseria leonii]|uniref:hypothetical protein n=1 Tax=Neisseria leonii TaxID=2995413 RepID=UPI00237B3FF2|nr:hypothetical protein [Neisseria sp. 3986]MDD9326536.1 hypothetical protein [Neisseria sp. 3986]
MQTFIYRQAKASAIDTVQVKKLFYLTIFSIGFEHVQLPDMPSSAVTAYVNPQFFLLRKNCTLLRFQTASAPPYAV